MFLLNRGDFLSKKLNIIFNTAAVFIFIIFIITTACFAKTNNQNTFLNEYTSERYVPVYSVDTDKNIISITVDGAWGNSSTEKLLKTFAKYDISVTFFFAGIWLEKNQNLVDKIIKAGHRIENHSYSHRHIIELEEKEIIKEIQQTDNLIIKLTGQKPEFFRPPYGEYNNKSIKIARQKGYQVVQWSIDTHDWMNPGIDYVISRIENNIKGGDILLFHNNAENIVKIMDIIIPKLKENYQIVLLSELIFKNDYKIRSFDGLQYQIVGGENK